MVGLYFVFMQLSPDDAVCHFTVFQHRTKVQLEVYLTVVNVTVWCLPEMGLEVSWLPKQEVVRLLSQQNLRGRMGFLY